ncbi:hypothetical protein WKW79_20495 [Variovorax robiniae]|uniref:CcmD family protein n=1 Tax=Variovorax robiniae TaxID=1836199 RepID=A0ABU8XAW7_9BURK
MDKLPLPTDNIYKFYALFGLLMFIFSIGAALVQNRATNTRIYELSLEAEAAAQAPDKVGKPSLKSQMLERLLEVERGDKKAITYGLVGLIVAGFYLMLYGFWKWHREVQPIQDELVRLQLQKLRREVGEDSPA